MLFLVFSVLVSSAFGVELDYGKNDTYTVKYEIADCRRPGYQPDKSLTKCYKFSQKTDTWVGADNKCKKDGAFLAIPRTEDEAQYLSSELRKITNGQPVHSSKMYFFVGIVKTNENSWTDSKGRLLNAAIPWAHGEPNYAGKEYCLTLDWFGQLNDYFCNRDAQFFCEYHLKNPLMEYISELMKDLMQGKYTPDEVRR